MTQQEINELIQQPHFQKIINEEEFYFLKGQQALNNWLQLEVSDQMKEDLIRLSSDYTQFLETVLGNPEIEKIKDFIFEIISYCDNRAKDKSKYNQYEDDRTVAEASVRMGNWVDGIIKFKFKHQEIQGLSIVNALNYLLNPQENSPVLSDNYREMIAVNLLEKEYKREGFIENLKAYFSKYELETKNPDNYTLLLANILYTISNKWQEDVVGLMASDGTGWHENNIFAVGKYNGLITWNSKKPSGGAKVLKLLRSKIRDGASFPLFYSVKGKVLYKANVIDFVTDQKEYQEKDWGSKKIKYFKEKFADHKDSKKSAKIVFLVDSLEKLEAIPVDQFDFFGKYSAPRQDNLSPLKKLPTDSLKAIESEEQNFENKKIMSLNQILFGPPGTGKTYHTINNALEIVGINTRDKSRKDLKEIFDQKVEEGQIVFTTFHQSMSYEDFIEGIKPRMSNSTEEEQQDEESEGFNTIEYDLAQGIFKTICNDARKGPGPKANFDSLWESFYKHIESSKEEVIFKSVESEMKFEKSFSNKESIKIRFKKSFDPSEPQGKKIFHVGKESIRKIFDEKVDLTQSKGSPRKEIRNIVGAGRATTIYAVYRSFFEYSNLDKLFQQNQPQKENYVLIIDEINRGNISQIFGELITLIEEDKRLGKEEALEVTLPYSKEKFGVPSNLYIIGTMNTADRSVEALDTALRRRFSFTEMPPKPELLKPSLMLQRLWIKHLEKKWKDPVWIKAENDFKELHDAEVIETVKYKGLESDDNLNLLHEKFDKFINFKGLGLSDLLIMINKRIEKLLDRDHLIGHSYFIKVNSWEDLKETFYKNIIPLLQEYFFGDYAKIGAVVGKGFVKVKESENEASIFADFEGFEPGDFNDKIVYEIVDYRKDSTKHQIEKNKEIIPMDFEKAIKALMNLL